MTVQVYYSAGQNIFYKPSDIVAITETQYNNDNQVTRHVCARILADMDEMRMYVASILFSQVSIPMYDQPYVEYKIMRKKTTDLDEFLELGHVDLFEKMKAKVFGPQWTVHYGMAGVDLQPITIRERNDMIHNHFGFP